MTVKEQTLEEVKQFNYFGCIIAGGCMKVIQARMAVAKLFHQEGNY